MKLFFKLLLLVILIAPVTLFHIQGEIEAAVDANKPTLSSMNIDKKEVSAGESVTFTATASDVDSGVKQITLLYVNPVTGGYIVHTLSPQADGNYKFTYKIPTSADKGNYVI